LEVVKTRPPEPSASWGEAADAVGNTEVGQCPGGARKSTKGVFALFIERLQGSVRNTGKSLNDMPGASNPYGRYERSFSLKDTETP
jgi:hypothetical protein